MAKKMLFSFFFVFLLMFIFFTKKMFIFGVTVVLYFVKILSGSRNFSHIRSSDFNSRLK